MLRSLKNIYQSLRRERRFACLLFLVLSAVPLWGALSLYLHLTGYFYAVYAGGVEVGLLSEREALEEVLGELEKEARKHHEKPVMLEAEIEVEKVFRPMEEDQRDEVYAQLQRLVSYKVEARMLLVNGQEIYPLDSDKEAAEVLKLLGDAFVPEEQERVSLESIRLKEQVRAKPHYCYPEEIRSAELVANLLLQEATSRETHLASRGDSLWEIARAYDLSVEELQEANPQLVGDLIREGEELSLNITAEPLVNVITVERAKVEEEVPYGTEYTYDSSMWYQRSRVGAEGSNGLKEVTYRITRENGEEIERKKIDETVLEEPSPRVVVKGTAKIPTRGSGTYTWPVQGGGRLTSGFGMRNGRFHAGIDIAAPTGTGILAADSGVVVFSGWDGGYGLTLVIRHGNYYTRYAHNSSNLVRVGETVERGQLIGRIGSTGNSTGAHLHFEVRRGGSSGTALNPINFF